MNETADVAHNLPAIVLLSWWVAVSMLRFLLKADGADPTENLAADQPDDASNQAFPALREADPGFNAETFLSGARRAYEEILRAYGLCELDAVQPLLSQEVFVVFAEACRVRMAKGEILELALVGIQSSEIVSADITAEAVEVTVLFRADIIQTQRPAANDGDNPATVASVADLWTFSRPRPIGREMWRVIATDEALQAA